MRGLWIAACAVVLCGTPALAGGGDHATDEALEHGRLAYRMFCANCHGEAGRGDGPTAKLLSVPPADLTGIAARNGGRFPVDDVERVVDGRERVTGHGASAMPIWGLSFRDFGSDADQEDTVRARIELLVRYLATIQARGEETAPGVEWRSPSR